MVGTGKTFIRKGIAVIAAGALTLSMFGCAGVAPQAEFSDEAPVDRSIDEVAAPLASADDVSLTINAGAATLVPGEANTYYFPHLTVESTNPNRPIKSITVQFTSAITDSDEIYMTDSGNFKVLDATKHGNKSVNNESSASTTDWETYLRENMKIKLSDESTAKSLRMIASFDPTYRILDYNAANGHYYEVAKGTNNADVICNWSSALKLSGAAHTTYLGMQGYLVTVTDQQEHDFVYALVKTDSWMGGTCDINYAGYNSAWAQAYPTYDPDVTTRWARANQIFYNGNHAVYYWVCGPEAGKEIGSAVLKYAVHSASDYTRTVDPETGETMFMNFNPNLQPDGASGKEMYIQFNSAYQGFWNDLSDASTLKYVIEYGGLPGEDPEALANANVDVFVKVDINLDPTGKTITTEAYSTEVGEPLNIKENVNGDETVALHDAAGNVLTDDNGNPKTSPVTRTYKIKDPETGEWRDLTASEKNENGEPIHAGTYQVQSSAVYGTDSSGTEIPYKSDPVTFTIKPRTIVPVFSKVYDGTTDLTVGDIDISDQTLSGADVTMKTDSTASFNDPTVAGATSVTIKNPTLSGSDVSDYVLGGISEDGSYIAKGVITPRELVITASSNVNWGLAAKALKAADGSDPAYKTNLAIHGTGDWTENELASRDANSLEDTILGQLSFSALAGSVPLDAASPAKGVYGLTAHYANVNASGVETQSDKSTVRLMAEEEGDGAADDVKPETGADKTATGLDVITAKRLDDGRYDIGNYILTLKGANILITDDPYAEDAFDDATKFISGVVNTQVSEDAKPLTDDEILDLIRQIAGGDLPEGTPNIQIFKNGEPVDTIDPSELGSYAIVATYPNPDGEDEVVRVGYNVLQDEPFVMKETVTVPVTEDAAPVTKTDLQKLVENMIPDWIPAGVSPTVSITDADGHAVKEIDLSVPGVYNVTLTYVDESGVAKQVELSYTVADTDNTIIEGIDIPRNPNGKPITGDDIVKRIEESYPGLIPDGLDPVVTITKDGRTVDAVDPTQPGTYEVTIEYRDPETGEVIRTVKTTYTVVDDPAASIDDGNDDGNVGDGTDDGSDNDGSLGDGGNGASNGSAGSAGNGSGSSTTSGAKGFNDVANRLLAQTGDPVFWVICGIVVVAVVAGVVLVVSRRKSKRP